MFLNDIACLVIASACATAAPAAGQSVPEPQPRPAQLSPTAPAAPAPVAAVPAQPPAAAPAQAAAPQAPQSIGDLATATAAPSEPAPSEPPAPEPAAAAEPAAVPLPQPAPQSETAAVEWKDTPDSSGAAPLNLQTPGPSGTQVALNPVDTPAEVKTLGRVNTYFNGIRTLQGTFTQIGPDGSRAGGKFFLAKPGKLRFYYQRPSTTDIIADGKSLVVRDRKLATQDVYPLSQTPLKFLLSPNLDLSRDSKVVGVYEEPGLVSVAIEEETTFGGKARLLLSFVTEDGTSYELKQWTITDAQGLNTTVAVANLDTETRPDEKLFAVDYTRYNRSKR